MVLFVACLLGLLASASAARGFGGEEMAVNLDRVLSYNEDGRTTWVAGENDFFKGVTLEEAKRLMGTRVATSEEDREEQRRSQPTKSFDHIRDEDIPTEFDARAQWPNFIHPIRNQQQCGSCWAFGAVEALSDRFAIATNGSVNVVLSPEQLVSCDDLCLGCNGCLVNLAWRYLTKEGTVTESCFPYLAGDGRVPPCPSDSGPCGNRKYKTSNYYRLDSVKDIQVRPARLCSLSLFFSRSPCSIEFPSIRHSATTATTQKAIMIGGPVEAGFLVHQSFMSYRSGVYQRPWWDLTDLVTGGHAVKVRGTSPSSAIVLRQALAQID